jgi:hypothetical protein
VGVDAEMIAGNLFCDLADNLLDLLRQRAAVGVAEDHPPRAGIVGRLCAGKRVAGVRLVSVEEMLAVEQHFPPGFTRRRYRLPDAVEIVFLGRLQRHPHLVVGRLGHKADGIGFRFEKRAEAGIV